jgi:hypothetical protein
MVGGLGNRHRVGVLMIAALMTHSHDRALEAAARALSEPTSAKDAASLQPHWRDYLPFARKAVRAYLAALPAPPAAQEKK